MRFVAERYDLDALPRSQRREHYPEMPESGMPGVLPGRAVQQSKVLLYAVRQPRFYPPLPWPGAVGRVRLLDRHQCGKWGERWGAGYY